MTGAVPAEQAVLELLGPHFSTPSARPEIGPGWRQLVIDCHRAVVAEFPDYELGAVKQKFAVLAFQASPRPWKQGGNRSSAESDRLRTIVETFAARSASICERCGAVGLRREGRRITLTLCYPCELAVPRDLKWPWPLPDDPEVSP
ncbi:hypothetical protein ACFYST_17110 [Kitasatospora sp. NPDC004614]|uniref:hypothetical protein n=1 Tax=unclassified Kitasatospora TaxID=2633591 RepID=UPI0036784A80